MTPEQQAALVEAARKALPHLTRATAHRASCGFTYEWESGSARTEEVQARYCTCGLWETREGLRAALEAAERDATS